MGRRITLRLSFWSWLLRGSSGLPEVSSASCRIDRFLFCLTTKPFVRRGISFETALVTAVDSVPFVTGLELDRVGDLALSLRGPVSNRVAKFYTA